MPTFLSSTLWTILEVEEDFMQSLSTFLLLVRQQKNSFQKPFWDLFFYPFITEFFRIA